VRISPAFSVYIGSHPGYCRLRTTFRHLCVSWRTCHASPARNQGNVKQAVFSRHATLLIELHPDQELIGSSTLHRIPLQEERPVVADLKQLDPQFGSRALLDGGISETPMLLRKFKWKKEVLQTSEPVLVDFWASWCPPCQTMNPIIEALARDFKVCKVNVDTNEQLVVHYGISFHPTAKAGRVELIVTTSA
jgi:thiol-disulfide isomerase/thioredoxin